VTAERPLEPNNEANFAILGGEMRGGHNSALDSTTESEMVRGVTAMYADLDVPLVNEELGFNAREFFNELNPPPAHQLRGYQIPVFRGSKGYTQCCKLRNGLSTRRPGESHGAANDPEIAERIQTFQRTMQEHVRNHGPNKVGNADETAMHRVNPSLTTIGRRGAESVHLNTGGSTKDCWTFIPIITANGRIVNTAVVRKGKTMRTFANMELEDDVLKHFNDSGWSDEAVMMKVIADFAEKTNATELEPSVLGWDVYWTHRTDAVRECAADHHVILEFVPAGATSQAQPLDVGIFGPLKSKLRKQWRLYRVQNQQTIPIGTASAHFFNAINELEGRAMIKSFRKAGWLPPRVQAGQNNEANEPAA
jgi:hypothetical protein